MKRGFTIVELLIVIVVIGILAAITIVSFNGITERARISAGTSFAAQIRARDLGDAVGFWNFDQCSGASIVNSGGNAAIPSNSVTGTLTYSSDTPSGTGCSLSLNGSSWINTGVGLSNNYYSKSLWFKTSSTAASMNFISDAAGGAQSAFYLSSTFPSSGHNAVWNSVRGASALNDNKWHFAYLEFKMNTSGTDGTMTLSIDGTTVATNTSIGLMSTPGSVQEIGAFGNTSTFTGLVDDVMIVTK